MQASLSVLKDFLPFLIPVAVLQLGLMLAALIHVIRHPKTKNLGFVPWLIIILLVNIIGPVLYFAIGRGEE